MVATGWAEEDVEARVLSTRPTSPHSRFMTSRDLDHSTCSDGSLLSMGSSDLDEDSFGQSSSRHSSKLSLQERRAGSGSGQDTSERGELDVGVSTTPLSHSAARHKMAVKPKRTHGAPRRRRLHGLQQLTTPVLPATPELNEESSGRSVTPELQELRTAAPASCPAPPPRDRAPSPDEPSPAPEPTSCTLTPLQLKSASLPPGLAPGLALRPAGAAVTRSRSSAAYRQERQERPAAKRSGSSEQLQDDGRREDKEDKKKDDLSFFGRLLSRRSGKKKKAERAEEPAQDKPQDRSAPNPAGNAYYGVYAASQAEEESSCAPTRRMDEKGRYIADPADLVRAAPPPSITSNIATQFLSKQMSVMPAPRARQRMEPATLPQDDLEPRELRSYEKAVPLEGVPVPVKPEPVTRMQISYSTSPTRPSWMALAAPPVRSASETKVVEVIEKTPEARQHFELEAKLKTKIPGLSAYQQRVTQVAAAVSDTSDERDFSSLSDSLNEDPRPARPVAKSRSFRREGRELDRAPLSLDTPSLPAGLGLDIGCDAPPEENYRDVLKQFDDEINTISLTHSEEAFSGSPDSLEPCAKAPMPASATTTVHIPERPPEPSSEYFSKNVFISAKSVAREPTAGCDSDDTKLHGSKGKSSSLDSIESFRENKAAAAAAASPVLVRQKATSSESISLGGQQVHQVTIPLGSGGLSITQQVMDGRQELSAPRAPPNTTPAHSVTVACVPASVPPPAPASTASIEPPSAAPKVTLVNLSSSPEKHDKLPSEKSEKPEKPALPEKPEKLERLEKTEKPDFVPESPCGLPPAHLRTPALRKSTAPTLPSEEPAAQVPEFMRVQLNRVDSKPAVNVVLSTGNTSPAPESERPEASEERLQRRRSTDILDPWSVEELPSKQSPKAEVETVQVTMLGLRVKRVSSRDDLTTSPEKKTDIVVDSQSEVVEAPVLPAKPDLSPPPKKQKPVLAPLSLPSTPAAQKFGPTSISAKSPVRKQASKFERAKSPVESLKEPLKKPPAVFSEDNNNVVIVEKKKPVDIPPKPSPEDGSSLRRRSTSRDSLSWLPDEQGRESVSPDVIMRKKSLPRESRDQEPSKDDTPELMKVFARRSLKVRDSESEQLSAVVSQSWDSETSADQMTRSRDSDKENEGGESPKEERKKSVDNVKDAPVKTNGTQISNGISGRYQRSLSSGNEVKPEKPTESILAAYRKENLASPDKRLRTRNMTEPVNGESKVSRWNVKDKDPVLDSENSVGKLPARWTLPPPTPASQEEEHPTPRFKRIQQRREEWEQRVQQAAKAGP